MSKVCMSCRGQKKVLGMGWIETECANCDGLGRMPSEPIYIDKMPPTNVSSSTIEQVLSDALTSKDRVTKVQSTKFKQGRKK
jgi:DnaJ-class molecular chaperone